MARRETPFGEAGRNVATIVARLRESRAWTYAELHRRLDSVGCSIPTLGLSRLEREERIVTPDELIALAEVFDVDVRVLLGLIDWEPPQEIEIGGATYVLAQKPQENP